MRTIWFIVLTLVTVASLGSPVKSILGGRHSGFGTSEAQKTAKDYVQDGMVSMWDGIENVGWGIHEDNPDVFVDLVGLDSIGKYGASSSTVYPTWFSADALCAKPYRNGEKSSALLNTLLGQCTVELCATRESTGNTVGFVNFLSSNWLSFAGFIGLRLLVYNRGTAQYIDGFPNVGPYRFSVTLVVDSDGIMTIYKDGIYFCKVNPGTMSPPGNGGWFIGQNLVMVDNINTFALLTHSVRVYSRPLTAAEIAANYAIDKERFNLK